LTYKETKKGLNQAVRDFQYVAENSPIDKTLSDAPVANIIIAENEKLSVINQTSLGDTKLVWEMALKMLPNFFKT